MSWIPFKKAFSGRRTRTEDVEFEREVNKLRQMQAVSKRMYKDMRKCNETETALVRSSQRLVSNLKTSQHGKIEPLKHTVEVLVGIVDEVYVHSKALKTNQDITFTEPMKKFNNVYKHVEFHAKQRELKLQEYDKQQSKLDKLGRKSGGSMQLQVSTQTKMDQLQRSLTSARLDYERVHGRLIQEMPELFEGRVEYFDLSLQAVIKAQALYYHSCSETLLKGLSKLQSQLPDTAVAPRTCDVMSEESIVKSTEKYLDDIRTLSIVGNTPVP